VLNNNCLLVAGCTAQQMANHDMAEWNAALNTMPGGGVGFIVQTAGAGTAADATDDVFTISVNWDDDKDGSMDNDGDGDVDVDDALFTLGFTL
jgi:type IV pilus assembly protein PilV